MKRFMIIAVIAGLMFAAGLLTHAQSGPRAVSNPTIAIAGRYQIFFSPFARADVYLVDTQSGLMWRPVTYTDIEGDPEVWVPATRLDTNGQLQAWLDTRTSKKKN